MIHYLVVGMLYTRTCPLSCRHCIISSSPKERDKMTTERAKELIDQMPSFTSTVCFTGGEPMLYYNEILPLIRQAVGVGLKVTMVTGAGWVSQTKPQIARNRIQGLKVAGLASLCVSWDIYHEEFSVPENALLVIEEAKAVGLPVHVRGVIPASGAKPEIEDRLVTLGVDYGKVNVIRLGHASTLPEEHFTFTDDVERGGCGTVLSPTIEPDGSVYACCGPSRSSARSSPLVLGNVNDESLASILTRGMNDPILEAIHHVGLFAIAHLLRGDERFRAAMPARAAYTGMCELCLDICNTPAVVEHLRERLSKQDARALVSAARMAQRVAQRGYAPQMIAPNNIGYMTE